MNRRNFVKKASLTTAGIWALGTTVARAKEKLFQVVRVPANKRKFTSSAIDGVINKLKSEIGNKELAWMFENCFPNTLDTTVDYSETNGKPDTYVITGDIDAMWLRDSSAQVYPYVQFCTQDRPLQHLIAGVINRQTRCILKDPYANAFYKDENKISEWAKDDTKMLPGVHERKWEIDSLCYPIRLAHTYYGITGDMAPFDAEWLRAMKLIVQTFTEQQRKTGSGPYKFMRETKFATDTQPLGGYGYPVKPAGLICSMFRPSDDATLFPLLIPSNLFAVAALEWLADLLSSIYGDSEKEFLSKTNELANQVRSGLKEVATVDHAEYGRIYAYETNGMGSYNLMDDANMPSLVSLGYLMPTMQNDPVYKSSRKFALSASNPFFFSGRAGTGIGGPHAGINRIWPLSIIMRAMTSDNDEEIGQCLQMLCKTHAGTGMMHESFEKDNAADYTRPWFAWANTAFGELVLKVHKERPHLLA